MPKEAEVIRVVNKIEAINPDIKVFIRRHFGDTEVELSKDYALIEPEFEASLKILEKILPLLGKRDRKIIKWLREQRDLLV